MGKLRSGIAVDADNGIKSYVVDLTSGTVTFSISVGGSPFVPITDGVISATGTGTISLPDCKLKADFTNASVYVDAIQS